MSKKTGEKTAVFVADLHTGSRSGLTAQPENATQEKLLEHWKGIIRKWGGPDALIVNGDAINGASSDNTQPDRLKQAMDAADLLAMWNAKRVFLTYGTDRHVSSETGEDFEEICARMCNGEARDRYDDLNIGGVSFNVRHFCSGSGIPHGRHTAMGREILWAELESLLDGEKLPDIVIRAHVHYFGVCGHDRIMGYNLPCWQAKGCKYGGRKCSGRINIGAMRFTCADGEARAEWSLARVVDEFAGRAKI